MADKPATPDNAKPAPAAPEKLPSRLLASVVRPAFHGLKAEGKKDRGTLTKAVNSDATAAAMPEVKVPGSTPPLIKEPTPVEEIIPKTPEPVAQQPASVDRRGESRHSDDRRAEDRRTEPRLSEDRRSDSRRSDDQLPEDRRTEDRRKEARPTEDRRKASRRIATTRLPPRSAAALRHDPNHVYEPHLHKRRTGNYAGLFFVLVIGFGFIAYVFGYLPIDKLFDQGNSAIQSHNNQLVAVITRAAPVVGLAFAVLMAIVLLRRAFSKD